VLSCGEMGDISPEDVRVEVRRFWAILLRNVNDKLEDMYSPTALVFTGKNKRSESAKVMAVRRSRQMSEAGSTLRAELDSIGVDIVGPDVAIATYTYRYHREKIQADGTTVGVDALFGRATQIFQRDEAGVLRIVHEHLSAGAAPQMAGVTK